MDCKMYGTPKSSMSAYGNEYKIGLNFPNGAQNGMPIAGAIKTAVINLRLNKASPLPSPEM
jgi:hypothetical protein